MHFFVILRAGRLFLFIGQLYYFTQLPAGKVKPAGMILPAGETKNFCQLAKLYQLVKCKVAASWHLDKEKADALAKCLQRIIS